MQFTKGVLNFCQSLHQLLSPTYRGHGAALRLHRDLGLRESERKTADLGGKPGWLINVVRQMAHELLLMSTILLEQHKVGTSAVVHRVLKSKFGRI